MNLFSNLKLPVTTAAWACLVALASSHSLPAATVAESWTNYYISPVPAVVTAVGLAADSAGNVIITAPAINNPFNFNLDFYTAKYARTDGSLLWERYYNRPPTVRDDAPSALAVDADGNVVVTGWTTSTLGNSTDFYTAKYAAADGALLWEKSYNHPSLNQNDRAVGVATDGAGNVVVTGSSFQSSLNSDCHTIKYAALDGAVIWERRYNGPALVNNSDSPRAVIVAAGNVVVTGSSTRSGSSTMDAFTIMYAAADGATVWESRFNGPANDDDFGTSLAVDPAGDVILAGYSWNGTTYDYFTRKHAAADGALRWERWFASGVTTFNSSIIPSYPRVAVDAAGNAFLSGFTYDSLHDADYYTVKYAANDGATLWERRYNSPQNSGDIPHSLALASNGDVVVTGSSNTGDPNYDDDYYTVRYASADGTVVWEQRHGGAANAQEIAVAVAIDPQGGVLVTGSAGEGLLTIKYIEPLLPPEIVAPPQSVTGYWGHSAAFTVNAMGTPPLTYQWLAGGVAIQNATNASLVFTNLGLGDGGSFQVVVCNPLLCVTSAPAQLTIQAAATSLGLYPGVTLEGVVGRTYGIQSTTDLSDTNSWITLTNLTLSQPNQLWIDTAVNAASAVNPRRFYRVLAAP